MMKNKVFKTDKLLGVELRYISHVTSCDKEHQHPELTLTAIDIGEMNILFDDKTDRLSPAHISVVNPYEVHCATLSDTESFGCYVLYLHESWCLTLQKALFKDLKEYAKLKNTLIYNEDMYKKFISVCRLLLREDVLLLEKEEALVQFVSSLFLDECDISDSNELDEKNSKIAKKIKDYIEDNAEQDLVLKEIADAMGLSVVHVLRVFKKEFGLPIHSYLLNIKVHKAKELLAKNIAPAEVAQMCGFFDQSHLNRSFKRVFQLTPKAYQDNVID